METNNQPTQEIDCLRCERRNAWRREYAKRPYVIAWVKAYRKKWRKNNLEKLRVYQLKWCSRNREKIKAYNKQWYEKNKSK